MNIFKKIISLIAALLLLTASAHAWTTYGDYYVDSVAVHGPGGIFVKLKPQIDSGVTNYCFVHTESFNYEELSDALKMLITLDEKAFFACTEHGAGYFGNTHYKLEFIRLY